MTLTMAMLLACGSTAWAGSETYHVVFEESRFDVHVGRSGLFKMFGHDHLIHVRSFAGTVEWDPANPEASRFELDVDAASLVVADEEISDGDRAAVQDAMEKQALAVAEHTTIAFVSTRVEVRGKTRLGIVGELDLRGVRKELEIPVTLTPDGERIVVQGKLRLKSKEWGVPQISALGGSVKTRNELTLEFSIVAAK